MESEDRRKHLDFIQITIIRMAGNSFLLKGWALTLASALVALAVAESNSAVALIGVIPAGVFWWLDAYYLHQERAFRALYDAVRRDSLVEPTIEPFSLDTSPYIERIASRGEIAFSETIWQFYGALIVAVLGAAALVFLLDDSGATKGAADGAVRILQLSLG